VLNLKEKKVKRKHKEEKDLFLALSMYCEKYLNALAKMLAEIILANLIKITYKCKS
jgi:hypothetical protein